MASDMPAVNETSLTEKAELLLANILVVARARSADVSSVQKIRAIVGLTAGFTDHVYESLCGTPAVWTSPPPSDFPAMSEALAGEAAVKAEELPSVSEASAGVADEMAEDLFAMSEASDQGIEACAVEADVMDEDLPTMSEAPAGEAEVNALLAFSEASAGEAEVKASDLPAMSGAPAGEAEVQASDLLASIEAEALEVDVMAQSIAALAATCSSSSPAPPLPEPPPPQAKIELPVATMAVAAAAMLPPTKVPKRQPSTWATDDTVPNTYKRARASGKHYHQRLSGLIELSEGSSAIPPWRQHL
jgi:hypothetical protein